MVIEFKKILTQSWLTSKKNLRCVPKVLVLIRTLLDVKFSITIRLKWQHHTSLVSFSCLLFHLLVLNPVAFNLLLCLNTIVLHERAWTFLIGIIFYKWQVHRAINLFKVLYAWVGPGRRVWSFLFYYGTIFQLPVRSAVVIVILVSQLITLIA